jgi:putative ABC transport system substrate-binding protein
MRRRDFLAGSSAAALAWPSRAKAQSTRRPTIGMLFLASPEPNNGLIRAAMGRLGYREGETIDYELRIAEGSQTRLAVMAADLAARNVDLIVAATTPAVLAAKGATTTIPIIMAAAADPVGSGLVASLSRPGGNVTGVDAAVAELSATLLGLMREAIPSATRMGLVLNTSDPFHRRLIESVQAANRNLGVDLRMFELARPDELPSAFEKMAAEGIAAAVVQPTLPRNEGIALASRHKIATCAAVLGYAQQGGFMSYSQSANDLSSVAAAYIDRILKGAKPAEMPVRQPAQFDLVLNLKTARALGLEVPTLLLAKATDLIE